jgi:predicted enzyme related to lactoylglutathione lyase
MDGKITHVSIVVSNQKNALEFYTEKVGFVKKTDVTGPGGYRWVTVGPKDQDIELTLFEVGANVSPEQKEVAKGWAPAKSPPMNLRVADCRATHEALAARGVPFLQPPTAHPWGVVATFTDPDGNLYAINQLARWDAKKA